MSERRAVVSWIGGTLGGALALLALQGLTGVLLPLPSVDFPPSMAQWVLAADVLTAATLTALARRAHWHGWRLAAALFAVYFVVNTFTSLIEAVFFGILVARRDALVLMTNAFVVSAALAPAIVALSGRWRAGRPADAVAQPPGRLVVLQVLACSVLYLALYFSFGMLIYPYIRDFYATIALPRMPAVIAMQLFVRGPLFAASILLVARMLRAGPAAAALHGALVMSVLGGVAPLMVPNPYFPDAVRLAHFFEVTTENFIFGWVAGWLFASGRGAGALQRRPQPVP